ncbi:MAG: methylated-DNA--[protein]-cysteine S-methyltransferase [Opitutus sp.]
MQTHMGRVTFETTIGRCAVSWSVAGLTGFELPETDPRPNDDTIALPEVGVLIERVRRHLTGDLQDFSNERYDFAEIPAFNVAVLTATLAIKAGQTRSYGDVARATGQPIGVSRAVGTALGANRWPLLIPCHRVVSANGSMTGFSGPGGIKTKLRLLAIEGAQLFAE